VESHENIFSREPILWASVKYLEHISPIYQLDYKYCIICLISVHIKCSMNWKLYLNITDNK
jgi:hypothetical protein